MCRQTLPEAFALTVGLLAAKAGRVGPFRAAGKSELGRA